MGEIQEKKFTEEQQAFIDYMCLPEDIRGTQKDLAEEIGVSEKTLCQWKKREDILAAVKNQSIKMLIKWLPSIIDELGRRAAKGSTEHIDRALKLLNINIENENRNGKGAVNIVFSGDIPRPKNGYDVVNIKGGD